MSPIVIIVFAPIVLMAIFVFALLFGAVAAGAWEAAEGRAQRKLLESGRARSPAAMLGREFPRAA
jgi:hypothetical protein